MISKIMQIYLALHRKHIAIPILANVKHQIYLNATEHIPKELPSLLETKYQLFCNIIIKLECGALQVHSILSRHI